MISIELSKLLKYVNLSEEYEPMLEQILQMAKCKTLFNQERLVIPADIHSKTNLISILNLNSVGEVTAVFKKFITAELCTYLAKEKLYVLDPLKFGIREWYKDGELQLSYLEYNRFVLTNKNSRIQLIIAYND